MIKDIIFKCRSYRRFYEDKKIDASTLIEFISNARLTPSGSNMQPIKFIISTRGYRNNKIFKHLRWAGFLAEWHGPSEGERPTAYIIVLGDKDITGSFGVDHGIISYAIMLQAAEKGYGGCIIGSIDRDGLRFDLGIADRFEILLVLALGVPKEAVKIEDAEKGGDTAYWRDPEGVHHVPKRSCEELIIEAY